MNETRSGRLRPVLWHGLRKLLSERLTPLQASLAVSLGIAVGITPIYGAQSIVAIALASALRLNRPLTVAATFINNPLLQPLLILGSLEIGHVVLNGQWMPMTRAGFAAGDVRGHLGAFALGSLVLAAVLAPGLGAFTYAALSWRARRRARIASTIPAMSGSTVSPPAHSLRRCFREEVARRYAALPLGDRAFVWWKVRLDRVFDILLSEDLGRGVVVDLGCGRGLALLVVRLREPERAVRGCDLDPRRVRVARQALGGACGVSVADATAFEIESAGLILIIDVLQYLARDAQRSLLARCARGLQDGGRLIFRVPEKRPGGRAALARSLDVALFGVTAAGVRPTHLSATDYREWLEELGFTVSELHIENRLPLSHVLFVATKPGGAPDA